MVDDDTERFAARVPGPPRGRGTMSDVGVGTGDGPVRRLAEWGARRDSLPTSLRAVLGYYAATGEFDSQAVLLKRRVDETMDRLLADLYETVETALEAEFDVAAATFRYETKLTLPAELTLGYLYRQATERATGRFDPVTGTRSRLFGLGGDTANRTPPPNLSATNREAVAFVDRAEGVTDLIVKALLDGDMRDAINDAEFEDFEVNDELSRAASIQRVAEVAQETLRAETERLFDRYPDEVRAAYDRAVDISESHQDEDDAFRATLRDARAGEPGLATRSSRRTSTPRSPATTTRSPTRNATCRISKPSTTGWASSTTA
ncbi:hypothetical protein [Haloplanus sp. GCM10025708]|uniref:hypothetical protein n=1 Tax=Haloplanus sp. GCM10025708 TaxID=3252679 RepID=UPI0036D21A48